MKPAPFKYIAATSLEHALALKAEYGDDAKFLAGGQSLMPAMNFRLARPAILVDINEIEELAGISSVRWGDPGWTADRVTGRCSAMRLFAQLFPLIAEALPYIAHPQIRNRGTIGGNLSHADPASELSGDRARPARPVPRSGGETRNDGSRHLIFLRARSPPI